MPRRAPRGNASAGRRLLAVLCLVGLAGCGRAPPSQGPPAAGDQIEAWLDGAPVWTSDVREEASSLGLAARGEALARSDPRFRQALDERIDEHLLALEAHRQHLDGSPVTRRRLAAARERLLGDLVLNEVVDGAADPDRVRKLREDLGAGAAGQPRPDAEIVRFLSYQAVKDLILSLRQSARIETPRPPGEPRTVPPTHASNS